MGPGRVSDGQSWIKRLDFNLLRYMLPTRTHRGLSSAVLPTIKADSPPPNAFVAVPGGPGILAYLQMSFTEPFCSAYDLR